MTESSISIMAQGISSVATQAAAAGSTSPMLAAVQRLEQHVVKIAGHMQKASGKGPASEGTEEAAASAGEAQKKVESHVSQIATAMKPSNMLKKVGGLFTKGLKGAQKGLLGGFTFGALIRQSQIFTATVGSFMQIAGAMVDTILAPLAPMIAKTIGWTARNGIGAAQKLIDTIDMDAVKGFIEKIPTFMLKILPLIFPVIQKVKSAIDFVLEIFSAEGGFMGMVTTLTKKLWDGVKFMGSAAMNNIIKPLWNKVMDIWDDLRRKAKFDFPGMPFLGIEPHTIYLFGSPRHVKSSSEVQRNVVKGLENLQNVQASEVARLDISKTTDFTNFDTGKSIPNAFIQQPQTAAEVVTNLQTGSKLVQDIYSGYHRGGEGSGIGVGLFSAKTVGLEETVKKVIALVNSPTLLAGELKAVLNATEATAIGKSISGGGGFGGGAGQYDEVTNTLMEKSVISNVLGASGFGSGLADGGR